MKKATFKFLAILLLVLAIVFAAHLFILQNMELPIFADRIVLSYVINYALAAAILIFIQSKFNKKSSHTGFIFLGGSGLKFLVFFFIFYPFYREDGTMATSEFAAFFVPYATCLILEVAFLSKQLNNQDF
ncbi:MAG TPA: DUF6168 family protein [Aequorivita sp.]|jgi:hypothetical protein|nr:hypothetical protein [Aequorivita sp.]HBC02845.1 hypothetical protein [Aequorivita sp.]HNP66366.1 DUF6168 family protein [Aequorivita sp.]|tara:strand:+ start:1564 stop:1953 length:390 start_codon:yes stop_codon:yes gene_type:complete